MPRLLNTKFSLIINLISISLNSDPSVYVNSSLFTLSLSFHLISLTNLIYRLCELLFIVFIFTVSTIHSVIHA